MLLGTEARKRYAMLGVSCGCDAEGIGLEELVRNGFLCDLFSDN